MSQSLYTSMGGISSAQSQLSVVSNNIANINTVGFKQSNVTFQDIFSTTITAGNSPTVTTGGKNPIQIGLGVQVGTISKNMESGTWTSTGKTTDMMIQGNGFFTVRSSDGEIFLTKAGNFNFDAKGDLVNAQGYKVVGADELFSTSSSNYTVNVPQKIVTDVTANTAMYNKNISDLNDCQLTVGDFAIDVTTSVVTTPVSVNLTATDNTMQKISEKIQAALDTQMGWTTPAQRGVTVLCDASTGGTIQFHLTGAGAHPVQSLSFVAGTSNFVGQTQVKLDSTTGDYKSKILDYNVSITPMNSLSNAVSVSNYSIAEDGTIEATYSNGDKMTVELNNNDNTYQFKYTTSSGVIIRGSNVNVNVNVASPANFVMQLANVVNPEGLVSEGGNLFTTGANSGDIMFTVGGTMGLGAIKSGGLEASNVDLSKQFSDMILAQRAIQANSRVFSTASSIMETLVMLGR